MIAWPALAVLLFVVAYLATAMLTLEGVTRVVPLIAGGVTLVLLLVDIVRPAPTQDDTLPLPPGREMNVIAYVAAAVIGIQLFGFWVTLPIYLFTSIAWLGKQAFRIALAVALLTSLSMYLLFGVLLGYRLYPGLLFS